MIAIDAGIEARCLAERVIVLRDEVIDAAIAPDRFEPNITRVSMIVGQV